MALRVMPLCSSREHCHQQQQQHIVCPAVSVYDAINSVYLTVAMRRKSEPTRYGKNECIFIHQSIAQLARSSTASNRWQLAIVTLMEADRDSPLFCPQTIKWRTVYVFDHRNPAPHVTSNWVTCLLPPNNCFLVRIDFVCFPFFEHHK